MESPEKVPIIDAVGYSGSFAENSSLENNPAFLKATKDKIIELEGKIKELEKNITSAENKMAETKDQTSKIYQWTIGIAFVSLATVIVIALDYLGVGYKDTVYTKTEVNTQIKRIDSSEYTLNCLKFKGYFSTKCFEK